MPIMQGTVALRAWRALPSAVRREAVTLARQGRPHLDPSVVRTALAAARAVQRWYEVAAQVDVAAAAALLVVWRFASGPPWSVESLVSLGVLAIALVLSVIVIFGRWGIWPLTSVRLEAVGVRHAVAHRPVAPPVPLTVAVAARPRRWRPLLVLGALLLVVVVTLQTKDPAPWWLQVTKVGCMAAAVGCALLLRWAVRALPPWARRRPRAGSPVLVLDDAGITLPHLGFAIPWPQVADVVVVADDQAGLALLAWTNPAPPTIVGIPAAWLSLLVEDVLAAARDHVVAARAAASTEN